MLPNGRCSRDALSAGMGVVMGASGAGSPIGSDLDLLLLARCHSCSWLES
jgi:hypothetical protein